jgi:release factor glutamine methyltransferase
MHVLDLGTGSGAIALAIKANTRHCTLWAIDKSQEALEVAKTNALKLGLDLHCVQSHWFEAWKDASQAHENLNTGGRRGSTLPQLFDLIVSNPPYIAPNDPHLKNLLHEPLNALIAQDEGMSDLRTIVQEARNHLNPGAWLILEHGYDQSAAVRNLMLEWGYFNVQSRSDLAGIERCTGAQWPKVK